MRFFLLDRIVRIVPGEFAEAIKCWSLDNEIFQDHFPGFPTVPGVLLTESMAQLGGILIEESYYVEYNNNTKIYPVLSIIQKAKFRSFVQPGDQCIIKAELISVDRGRGNVKVITFVDEKEMCNATLSFILGLKSDMKENPFIDKIKQYYHSIQPKKTTDE